MLNFVKFKELARLEQSPFGLPFVVTGALLPFANSHFHFEGSWLRLLWILPAFFAARFSGMAFNQLIDRYIDGRNPRTSGRPLPSGRIVAKEAQWVAWGGLIALFVIGSQINLLCFCFAPLVAILLFTYSYMKRFHASAHFVLGAIYFLAPFLAWAAVTGTLALAPAVLGLAAFFWISGNDIIYALNDYHFDCANGLRSVPVRFGPKKSLQIARGLLLCSIMALIALGFTAKLGWFYFFAPLVAAAALVYFHILGTKENRLFVFSIAIVSSAVMFFTLGDILWRVWL